MKKVRHNKEWYYWAKIIAYGVGLMFCIAPTLIAGIIKLPLITKTTAESTLSGVFIICLICAALPLYKALLKIIKTPNAAVICWILFALMLFIDMMSKETINGLKTVFMIAAIGNTLGAICFKISAEFAEIWKYCGQVNINNISNEV